jgi:hypothetical protein
VENVEKQVCQKKMNKPEKRVLTIWMRDGNLTKLSARTDGAKKETQVFEKEFEKNS